MMDEAQRQDAMEHLYQQAQEALRLAGEANIDVEHHKKRMNQALDAEHANKQKAAAFLAAYDVLEKIEI